MLCLLCLMSAVAGVRSVPGVPTAPAMSGITMRGVAVMPGGSLPLAPAWYACCVYCI